MEIPWHDYAKADSNVLIAEADLIESICDRQAGTYDAFPVNRCLSVRTSMNRLSKELGVTCTVDVDRCPSGLTASTGQIVFPVLKYSQYRSFTSKLYRMERFVENFPEDRETANGREIHKRLDEIE